ncbi:LysR family transcriptional regulator [Pigmentiphaga sp.]|uniref:LysR family transcriptional regulator n=1 Tax=Pigmentiphaga sp. TaxID=1977564 RepID=UPI0029CA03E1|nr:LysR family transcriptional regulator [Pigmentiphaga sp.]
MTSSALLTTNSLACGPLGTWRTHWLRGTVKTSRLLGVAQPALSRQVRALEVELRATLFHRHGRAEIATTICLIAQTRWSRSAVVVYALEAASRLFREVVG